MVDLEEAKETLLSQVHMKQQNRAGLLPSTVLGTFAVAAVVEEVEEPCMYSCMIGTVIGRGGTYRVH